MADEHHGWPTEDATERLLRGEHSGPADAPPDPPEAAALRAAFATLTAPGPAEQAAAREEEAVAAFRTAHRETGAGVVRLGRPAPAPSRWGRPVRFGLAVALGGFMIGGVAMAAGAGVLPSPFRGTENPAPAASVSADSSSPEVLVSPEPDPSEPASPTPPDSPSPPASSPGEPTPEEDETDPPRSGTPTPERSPHPGRTPSRGGGWDWEERTETACRAYEDGTMDAEHRRRLERLAKGGPGAIERFCRGVLDLPRQEPQLTLPAVPVPGTGGDRPDGGTPDFGYAPSPSTGDGEDAEDGAGPEEEGQDEGDGTGESGAPTPLPVPSGDNSP
ncbi:hypothetical protein AB0A84_22575 [Streptomyces albidoflavus]|uniref:Uncharacterized protein n=3 Tax=Streptomyces TaxID=1883 RepID=A0A7Y6C6Y9_9ACTN|nr:MULTISPECIES: hypothetical protein [Streptomyces]MBV1957098.1 hypothetical protein [Streptomyces sp. BV333]MCQ9705400.1 hypothetical protein [Streptomyces sp. BSP1]NUV27547.1 hypothetical protein [Streptomyces odorifer]UDF10628.1 hypothetical protein LH646_25305 [Streptomyces sp. WA1-19]